MFVPVLNRLFAFSFLHPWELLLCLATALVTVLVNEAAKLPLFRRRFGD